MVLANVCVMDPRSIIEGLSFLQLELSTDDITNPKPERVQMIYRVFCIAMLDVPETTLNHLPFDCEINPETAEMHHKSIPLALVFTIMKSFMADFADSQPDFTMCDMIAPNPKKTRKILSVLADYAIFHKPAYEIFLQTNSEYDEARKELDICNQEVNLCEERKRNLRSEEDSRKRRENALLAERNNRHAKFTQLMKDGEECDGRREAILRTIEKYKNDKTELLSEMESLHGQIDHLSKEIIRSPERVLAELDEQRKSILRTKENCNVERRRIMDIMDKIQLSQQVSKAIDQLWEDVQALLQFKNQLDMRQVEAADYERAADEAERKLKQLTESVKVAEQNSLDAINNHKRAKEMHEARRQQLSKRCEDLNCNLANLTMQGKDIRDEGRILQKELVAVKNKKGDALRKAKAECKNLTDRFKLLAEKHREERSLYNSAVKKFNVVLSSIESGMELDELTVANLSQTFHKMEADHC